MYKNPCVYRSDIIGIYYKHYNVNRYIMYAQNKLFLTKQLETCNKPIDTRSIFRDLSTKPQDKYYDNNPSCGGLNERSQNHTTINVSCSSANKNPFMYKNDQQYNKRDEIKPIAICTDGYGRSIYKITRPYDASRESYHKMAILRSKIKKFCSQKIACYPLCMEKCKINHIAECCSNGHAHKFNCCVANNNNCATPTTTKPPCPPTTKPPCPCPPTTKPQCNCTPTGNKIDIVIEAKIAGTTTQSQSIPDSDRGSDSDAGTDANSDAGTDANLDTESRAIGSVINNDGGDRVSNNHPNGTRESATTVINSAKDLVIHW